ncbi:MAG: PilN domain-containing protein [Methylotenera sp.]
MNRILLNHAVLHQTSALATALLLVGSLLSGAVFYYYQQIISNTKLVQSDIEQLTQPVKSLKKSRALPTNDVTEDVKTKAMNAAIADILLPWSALFNALESATPTAIKLIAVEPNSKKRTVRITALAQNNDVMMAYVDNLVQQNTLSNIALVSQEVTELSGQQAIQFAIEAVWKI